ncbi:uncharacterized protein LOC126896811 [Daktulosphaira vitifoliae]|uniref:uncharacterized protein LOC126896811 n=1 Tax=Daktulosphaira vitifoliae TaxID=58002 RepID=UPI0021AA0655|nr:uncharacterized protein LOC126896811 [Daktulosphaira vitifoliae]XP_050525862.1 uncharacterized protein LOC126896811 [Daktulosphaira vitifoliae]
MFMTKIKNHNENKVNMKEKTSAQLLELLERQDKLLKNKHFLDTLPDKGEKVKNFCSQIKVELEKRYEHDKLCEDLSELNIGKDQLDTLEWSSKHEPYSQQTNSKKNVDDTDVLRILTSHSGVYQDKLIIKEEPEEVFIKPSDLIDILTSNENKKLEDPQEFQEHVERYAKNLCGRIDTNSPKLTRFLPNKPIKCKENCSKITTPISLKESVTLQLVQENKIKEIKSEQSIRRIVPVYSFNTSSYREPKATDFVDFFEDEEDDLENEDLNESIDN